MFTLQRALFFKFLFFLSSLLIFSLLAYKIDKIKLQEEEIISFYDLKERKKIEKNLEFYYKIIMDFYATGGDPQLINEMPATKLVKHEIFKDIGMLWQNGYFMVLDLVEVKIKEFKFLSLEEAILKTKEIWNFQYQEIEGRKPIGEVRSFEAKRKYFFIKDKEVWFIKEVDYWKD